VSKTSGRDWRFVLFAVLSIPALALGGCTKVDLNYTEGPLKAPDCKYAEADIAAEIADQRYRNAEHMSAKGDAEAKAVLLDLRYTKDATERRKQQAQECEDRTREWSDLKAQWENARAASNVASLTNSQLNLTILEISLLLITVAGGVASIIINMGSVEQARLDSGKQADQFQTQLGAAYAGMNEARRIGEQQTRAYVLPLEARFEWQVGGEPTFEILYRNAGQTPAINVSDCVLFSLDQRPPPFNHRRVFAERPIVGGGELRATTTIPPTLIEVMQRSRAIGRLIADGCDVWAYVYYQDVFGSTFRTGARLISDVHFTEGASAELTVFFNDEASGFFDEIKIDDQGRHTQA